MLRFTCYFQHNSLVLTQLSRKYVFVVATIPSEPAGAFWKTQTHTRPDISAHKTCFLTHAVLDQKTSTPHHLFHLVSLNVLTAHGQRDNINLCALGPVSSGLCEGFPKRFSISAAIYGSVLYCWKKDAASPHSLLTGTGVYGLFS